MTGESEAKLLQKTIIARARNAATAFQSTIENSRNIDQYKLEDMALEALLKVKSQTDVEGLMMEDAVINTIRKTLADIVHLQGVEITQAPGESTSRFDGPVMDPRRYAT